MFEDLLAPFAQHLQRDAKTAVGRLRPGNGLKQEVHRRAVLHGFQLRGDMCEAARLRRHTIGVDQPGERAQNCANRFHRIRGRVHSNHRIPASEEDPLERGQQDPANVIHRVVGLRANSQHSTLAHRIPAMRHIPDFGRRENEVLVAHDFGDGRRDFGNNRPLEMLQLFLACGVVENNFAEFTHGHALDSLESVCVVGFQEQAADFVMRRIDQRLADNFPKGEVREFAFRSHAFSLRARGKTCQLIAGFLLVGLSQQVAQIAKDKLLGHGVPTGESGAG